MSGKSKILYVDDEEINLRLMEIHLCKNYEVLLATGGNKGLEILDANPDIKIVISDMRMPVMDGIDFISHARKKHPLVQFYILTGYEITDRIQKALDSGLINRYFSKPINPSAILDTICKALS